MLSTKPCMQCLLVFGMVSSLHPTSFLMIFILVSLIFYPGLALTVTGSEMVSRATRIYTYRLTRTRMRIVPEVVTFTCNQR